MLGIKVHIFTIWVAQGCSDYHCCLTARRAKVQFWADSEFAVKFYPSPASFLGLSSKLPVEWIRVFVSLCQPCDDLATCPSWTCLRQRTCLRQSHEVSYYSILLIIINWWYFSPSTTKHNNANVIIDHTTILSLSNSENVPLSKVQSYS